MSDLSANPALLEAVDGLIVQAVEFAGLKLRHSLLPRRDRWRAKRLPPARVHVEMRVEPQWLDRALDGAFDRVAEIAARFGLDPRCLRVTVEDYVRELLVAGQPHDYNLVPQVLRAPCLAITGRNADV